MRRKIASCCGGENITVNANVVWHAANETWILDPRIDPDEVNGAFCKDCDDSCQIEDEEE